MQDYYRIIDEAWKEGAETIPTLFNVHLYWNMGLEVYLDHMLFCTSFGSERDYMTEVLDARNKAWEAADDTVKERIRYIKEAHEQSVVEFEYY